MSLSSIAVKFQDCQGAEFRDAKFQGAEFDVSEFDGDETRDFTTTCNLPGIDHCIDHYAEQHAVAG